MVWATEEQLGGQDLARLQDLLLGRSSERRSEGWLELGMEVPLPHEAKEMVWVMEEQLGGRDLAQLQEWLLGR